MEQGASGRGVPDDVFHRGTTLRRAQSDHCRNNRGASLLLRCDPRIARARCRRAILCPFRQLVGTWAGYRAQAPPDVDGGTSRRFGRHLAKRVWRAALAVQRRRTQMQTWMMLPWIAARHDTFILDGRSTLLNEPELKILRTLRKTIIVVFPGSDHPPPFLSRDLVRDSRDSLRALATATKRSRQKVRRVEKNAHAIVALPSSAQFSHATIPELPRHRDPVRPSAPMVSRYANRKPPPGALYEFFTAQPTRLEKALIASATPCARFGVKVWPSPTAK
jgi:hypothetical protein